MMMCASIRQLRRRLSDKSFPIISDTTVRNRHRARKAARHQRAAALDGPRDAPFDVLFDTLRFDLFRFGGVSENRFSARKSTNTLIFGDRYRLDGHTARNMPACSM